MRVEPAHIEQIRCAADGRMVLISADASTVAADLQKIDRNLKVRFAENGNPPFWAVYWESQDGRETYLVSTFKAHQTASGTWTGLDDRIVQHIREIDPQSRTGYRYAEALEKRRVDAERAERRRREEHWGPIAERTAYTLRKDLGEKYRGRVFVTHKPQEA